MPSRFNPLHIFAAAFAISSFGGLASLLRSKEKITWRRILGATTYSGVMGLVIALLWYNYFDGQGNVFFLLGISGLAGIGGATVVDFVVQVLKKGGVQLTITPQDPDKASKDEEEGVDDDA